MSVETELKLRLAPAHLTRLKRHALLRTHQVGRPLTRRLYNIYYDTSKLDLQQARMALRLRRAGRQWLQTLKGGGSVQGGLHQRNEWEVPVQGAALDFSGAEQAVWDELLPQKLRKKLQPLFVTDFSRSSRMLEWDGAQIEVCMDRGEVRAGEHSTPICELELELKSGAPRRLFELALALLEIVPFELEAVSKAERGYRLVTGFTERPLKSEPPAITGDGSLAELLQALIWACLQHLQGNVPGALDGADPEYLHQLRVALRRLRVVLRLAEKFRADAELTALVGEVRALGKALGRLREWDVFIGGTLQPLCREQDDEVALQALLGAGERQRATVYAAWCTDDQARALQRLLLRFALWMNGPYWQTTSAPEAANPPVHQFLARRLRKLAKRFKPAQRQVRARNDVARLHALRIAAKELRYSAEFFAALYERKQTRPYLEALSKLQDVLGLINDVAVGERLLAELAAIPAVPRDAVARVGVALAQDLADCMVALGKALRSFNAQPAFWKK